MNSLVDVLLLVMFFRFVLREKPDLQILSLCTLYTFGFFVHLREEINKDTLIILMGVFHAIPFGSGSSQRGVPEGGGNPGEGQRRERQEGRESEGVGQRPW